VTILPGTGYPSFTVGYGTNGQVNDITDARLKIDKKTNLLFLGMNYDFEAAARHALNLSFSSTDRKDNTIYKRDQQNLNIQAFLNSNFSPTLHTTVGYMLSNNKSQNQLFTTARTDSLLDVTEINFMSVSAGVQLRLLEESLRINISAIPTFGDFNRTVGRIGVDFLASRNHSFELLFDYIQNAGMQDDMIGSIIYRFNF
jgi:hypothetical protein